MSRGRNRVTRLSFRTAYGRGEGGTMSRTAVTAFIVAAIVLVLSGCKNVLGPNGDNGASTNADLSALTVSSGTLSPSFSPGTTAYSVSVAHGVDSITVSGTAADGNASVSYQPAQPASLAVGANEITVTVTAQDGVTTKDYVVTVTRAAPIVVGIDPVPDEDDPVVQPESRNYDLQLDFIASESVWFRTVDPLPVWIELNATTGVVTVNSLDASLAAGTKISAEVAFYASINADPDDDPSGGSSLAEPLAVTFWVERPDIVIP